MRGNRAACRQQRFGLKSTYRFYFLVGTLGLWLGLDVRLQLSLVFSDQVVLQRSRVVRGLLLLGVGFMQT